MADFVGRMLGPYQITAELGHGGMANVYLASQPSVGRQVAIKVLPSIFLQDRTFLDRFSREVRLIAKLQHPRILPIYDFGEQDGVPYIVMAHMTGGTLADLIHNSRGGMGFDEVARLITQAAEGLDYAHEQGIIHRDFKPSNVLLDAKGNVHLADFGIAKATADTAQITGSGFVGTPAYAAPEMSTPDGLSPRVDVYALGVTLYQMLTGKLPYDAPTPMGVLMAHMAHPIPDLRQSRRDLPDSVQNVLETAMAKNPDERYQSAGEMASDLRDALSGVQIQTRHAARTVHQRTETDEYDAHAMTEPDQYNPQALTEPGTTPMSGMNTTPMTEPMVAAPAGPTAVRAATRQSAPTSQSTQIAAKPARPLNRWAIAGGIIGVIGLIVVVAFLGPLGGMFEAEAVATPFVRSNSGGESDLDFPLTQSAVFTTAEGEVYSFGLPPDGSNMVVGERTKLTVFDVETGLPLLDLPTGGVEGNINGSGFSPDGKYVMATIGYCVNVYDSQTGEYSDISDNYCDIGPIMYAFDFSSDGNLMAGGSGGSVIGLYDIRDPGMIWSGEEHEGDIHAVAFTPDDSKVASASADAQIIMWDVASGNSIWSIDMDTRDIWDMDLSPAGDQGAAGASNGTVLIFDQNTGEELRYLDADLGEITALAYSPDGSLLAVGNVDGTIAIFDTASGEHISDWDAHDGAITQLTWLHGPVLISSSLDGTIKFWE